MVVPLTVRRKPAALDDFSERVHQTLGLPLRAVSIRAVQVNVNGPRQAAATFQKSEPDSGANQEMNWQTMQQILSAATKIKAAGIDILGAPPETHPRFRQFVKAARNADLQVIVRSDFTTLLESRRRDLPAFLRQHRAQLVAPLPGASDGSPRFHCERHKNDDCIKSIQLLNANGYGIDPTLPLGLAFSPAGPVLPPRQTGLEQTLKRNLAERFGILFTHLLVIANMPIGAFLRDLRRRGQADAYLQKLRAAYNLDTIQGLMCRHQLHVAWDGSLHDCVFNAAIGLPVSKETPGNIRDFDASSFLRRRIVTAGHCFGCAAGHGSSCAGAIV
ncbi:MAG TPA: DUF3641 domain-containing protein [Tepidisphaeraceae bacterium]|nr:DUF3641 domain-containing protein [Tepidisphaeraceae bacterium]